jgi:hypothetical protein
LDLDILFIFIISRIGAATAAIIKRNASIKPFLTTKVIIHHQALSTLAILSSRLSISLSCSDSSVIFQAVGNHQILIMAIVMMIS